jgi:CBS domain-containing protein
MKVQDFMTHGVQTIRPADSLQSAAQAMWEHDCGTLPVIDEKGRVVAMLTDRDVCMAGFTQGRLLSDIPVATAMSRSLITCRPTDTVAVAEAAMRQHQIRRLPVVSDEGHLVGILSLNDIAIEAAEERAHKRRDVTPEEVGATLAAICRHRAVAPSVVEA